MPSSFSRIISRRKTPKSWGFSKCCARIDSYEQYMNYEAHVIQPYFHTRPSLLPTVFTEQICADYFIKNTHFMSIFRVVCGLIVWSLWSISDLRPMTDSLDYFTTYCFFSDHGVWVPRNTPVRMKYLDLHFIPAFPYTSRESLWGNTGRKRSK